MIKLKIKEIAEQRRLSMGKLSRMADVSTTTIKRIFDDPYYSATTHTLDKISKALGVHVCELLEQEPNEESR